MKNSNLPPLEEAISSSQLLLVDDNIDNLEILKLQLEWGGFSNTRCSTSVKEGLAALDLFAPDAVILDLKMPTQDGFDFLEQSTARISENKFLPIIVLTADLSPEAKIRALGLGASDFLTKPADAIEIRLRLNNLLQTGRMHRQLQNQNALLEFLVRQRTEDLEVARKEAVDLLARVCEYRDDQTGRHVSRVGRLSAGIASMMPNASRAFVNIISVAAPLHDIGKIAIPDSVLRKPGGLTAEEREEMNGHPIIGSAILGDVVSPVLLAAKEIALYHHERWDGRGYPFGLAGDAIPLGARIVTVADAFDAMTNDRPYRKGRSEKEALQEIQALSGIQFDPAVVLALQKHLNEPVMERLHAA